MLSGLGSAAASVSHSRSWDVFTRIVAVACFGFLGAASCAVVMATVSRMAASGFDTRMFCTIVVNACIFLQFLIQSTLVVCRSRALAKTGGVGARAVAMAGSWLIFAVVLLPIRVDLSTPIYVLAALVSAGGDCLAIVVVLHLGRSYSVMAEARGLVVDGPYAIVRHPLYLAEQLSLIGAVITFLSWRVMVLFTVQSCCQYLRARNEERILSSTFPAYADYRRRTPMLVPGT